MPRRLLKITIRSWRSRLSKSADFGGAFSPPLASKLFSAAKNFLCSRKHSLLFALCKYIPTVCGRNNELAAVKTGKAASIYVGIVTAAKILTDFAIRFFGDNASCCHFDAISDKGPKQA